VFFAAIAYGVNALKHSRSRGSSYIIAHFVFGNL